MDAHCELILEQYSNNEKAYLKIKDLLLNKLNEFVLESGNIVNSIEGRIKTYDSLKGKLERKGYKYNDIYDITDIVGVRLVTFYMDEIDKYAALVEKNFIIDWDNTIDKRKIYNIDEFGYVSLHYVGRIPKEMYFDPKLPIINEIRFEIQIRSILQHAWAVIQHDTGYKSDVEIPREYMRSFMRLAGLLELADETFCNIKNSIEDYRRRVKQVVKDGTLEELELNGDSFKAYIETGGFESLNKRIATIGKMEIEKVNLSNFLKVFKSFNFKTLKKLDDFVHQYSDLAYEFSVRQFSGKDIDIITSAAGPLALSVVFVLSNGMGENIVRLVLDEIYGKRNMNERMAARLTKIGRSMGLVKESDNNE